MAKKMMASSFVLGLLLAVSACTTTEELSRNYRSMSCMQLAEELGRQKAVKENADIDSAVASVESIFTRNSDDAAEAGVESIVADVEGHGAVRRIDLIRSALSYKGC